MKFRLNVSTFLQLLVDREVRLSMAHLAEQIFVVCAYLVNFQTPILK